MSSKARIGIIEQERREAVREHVGQMANIHADEVQEAYNRGRWQGRKDGRISEGRWWLFGVLCGVAVSALVWSFWP